jgi:WD40 repeat protein
LQVIASCGYWDNSIRCYSSEEGRLLQSLRQHKDIVTCIALGSDGTTLVSGGAALSLPWPLQATLPHSKACVSWPILRIVTMCVDS